MDCKYTTIKTCELKGSTFRSHVLNFGTFEISGYEFTTDFVNTLGAKIATQPLEKFSNTVVLPLTALESKSGNIRADVWMSKDGTRDLAVRFDISISSNCTGCSGDTTAHDITITYEELVIPVTVTQSVVNIYLDYESLTPEQQVDLRFDWEDFTPENIAELQAPAIEAATIATTATQNANEATEDAQVATEEAQTATTAANEATAGATTATNNANQAAGLATSATQESATATGEATAAASSANSAATAANAGAANAETKAILADTAASNAQAKATLADSAATNANDKAGVAQTAAANADQKAAAAQTATNNANTATTQANAARDAANAAAATANAARGWQPLLTADTTTIAGKTLLKLSDWIGGTGTKPTNYVGQWQKADGTYTSVASEAIDFTATFATRIASLENIVQNNTWYGVEWDLTVSNPLMTRIGNTALHQSLPIQSKMRRCLLKDDGSVNYYLDANDSTKKANGTTADLSGADGQVMVEIPKHYRRFDFEGNKERCMISENQLPDFHEVPKMYISAYQATVDRTIPATPKLASVVNLTANFRGGDNNATWDAQSRTLLGRPASSISLTNFRLYARNRGNAGRNGAGWNCFLYDANKAMFWLYMVEYANRNSQSAFNVANDSNGFKQGGLGNGVTDLDYDKRNTFNLQNPFVPMGFTNSLGNKTGSIPLTMPTEYSAIPFVTNVPSYRGIENPFGHIYHWLDGVKVRVQSVSAGGMSILYTSNDPSKFQDVDYRYYTEITDIARTLTYIKRLTVGEFGEITQAEGGAGSTTYWSDQGQNSIVPATGEELRGLFWGGTSDSAALAGLGCSSSNRDPSFLATSVGSRLTFLP